MLCFPSLVFWKLLILHTVSEISSNSKLFLVLCSPALILPLHVNGIFFLHDISTFNCISTSCMPVYAWTQRKVHINWLNQTSKTVILWIVCWGSWSQHNPANRWTSCVFVYLLLLLHPVYRCLVILLVAFIKPYLVIPSSSWCSNEQSVSLWKLSYFFPFTH